MHQVISLGTNIIYVLPASSTVLVFVAIYEATKSVNGSLQWFHAVFEAESGRVPCEAKIVWISPVYFSD
jgi:hypothetical protein